ncbi:MAG: DUF2828 family protein [Lachnospiraceae bacterium]
MKRAFWFDSEHMDQQIAEVDTTKSHVVHFAKNYNNKAVTENGAIVYRTTTKALLDLNFKVSSLRFRDEEYIVQEFIKAYHESPKYAVKWLFFLRDILEGMGERRTFRVCLRYLAVSNPKLAQAVIMYVPEYGRYDDALVLLDTSLAVDVANTNIEAVFDLILDMAKCKSVPREELPKQVLIISDMEFDAATAPNFYDRSHWKTAGATLFEQIEKKYEDAGYKMPRLIFWNVCGRSNGIPKVKNGEGLCLLSGFSQNAMKVAADKTKKDPYEALIAVLDSPRYQKIEDAIREYVA